MAGTGKSTIARTVAYYFHEKGRLGASFFFSKGKKDLSDASALFTTLAVQLTEVLPDLKRYVCEAITQYGDISQQPLLSQWEYLIFQPLRMLDQSLLLPLALVFVIDALDECDSKDSLPLVLRLLTKVKELKIVQVRIFITSRPETPVRLGFRKITDIAHYDLMLHSVPQLVIEQDISTFLKHKLAQIKEYKSLEEDWPSEADVQRLVKKSGRLFIYAATACRFLSKSPYPKKRLSEMLQVDSASHSSMKELDEMYRMILTNLIIEGQDADNDDVARLFKRIVGSIIVLFDSLSAPALTELLSVFPDEMSATLEPLCSVLDVPEDKASPIQLFHLSFRDFLLDKSRYHEQFWIDEKMAHNDLLERCLEVMSKYLRRNIADLRLLGALATQMEKSTLAKHLPLEVQYACRYWVDHLQQSNIQLCDDGSVHKFLKEHFLHWLEALSLMGNISNGVVMVRTLESILMASKSLNNTAVSWLI
jgi:hypothetical protein